MSSEIRAAGTPQPIGYRRTPLGMAGLVVRWVLLVGGAVVFLLPFYLIVRNALASEADISSPNWTLFPSSLHWENIAELFNDTEVPFLRSMWNSTVIGVLGTVGQLFFAALAGYGLARIPYKHANKVFYAIMGLMLLPAGVTFVPGFIIVSSFGWIGSLQGLIIPTLFSVFAAFLFRQNFLNFPKELEEAARIDGLGYLRTFFLIVIPNSVPFLVALAVITFIGNWNSFIWPLVINGQSPESWTVQISLATFITAQTVNIHELFMAAAIAMLPILVLFVFLQRHLIQGVAQTGIKG